MHSASRGLQTELIPGMHLMQDCWEESTGALLIESKAPDVPLAAAITYLP